MKFLTELLTPTYFIDFEELTRFVVLMTSFCINFVISRNLWYNLMKLGIYLLPPNVHPAYDGTKLIVNGTRLN